MKTTLIEELTLSLARGAAGKPGDGQIVTLIVAGFLAATNLRTEVDLGLVCAGACLLGILSVLERRQFHAIIRKLERTSDVAESVADGRTA